MIITTGDTHGTEDSDVLDELSLDNSLTDNDFIVQLGDFGWIWHIPGSNKAQDDKINFYATRKFNLLVVPGNHENYDVIFSLPIIEKWGGKVRVLESHGEYGSGFIYFLERGEIFNLNGKKCFVFGGALSIDKHKRIEGVDYWSQEIPSYSEFNYGMDNLDTVMWDIDYVFTHTCPSEIIEDVIHKTVYNEGKFKDSVAEYLSAVYKNLKFKEWHFGHFHSDVTLDFSNTDDGIFVCHYKKNSFL